MRLRINPSKPGNESAKNKQTEPAKTGFCVACTGLNKELHYHHWDYENDIGVTLCSECHLSCHEPEGNRPSESSGNVWVKEFLVELLKIYDYNHYRINEDVVLKDLNLPKTHKPYLRSAIEEVNNATNA